MYVSIYLPEKFNFTPTNCLSLKMSYLIFESLQSLRYGKNISKGPAVSEKGQNEVQYS